jgi:hypothetical protein
MPTIKELSKPMNEHRQVEMWMRSGWLKTTYEQWARFCIWIGSDEPLETLQGFVLEKEEARLHMELFNWCRKILCLYLLRLFILFRPNGLVFAGI